MAPHCVRVHSRRWGACLVYAGGHLCWVWWVMWQRPRRDALGPCHLCLEGGDHRVYPLPSALLSRQRPADLLPPLSFRTGCAHCLAALRSGVHLAPSFFVSAVVLPSLLPSSQTPKLPNRPSRLDYPAETNEAHFLCICMFIAQTPVMERVCLPGR